MRRGQRKQPPPPPCVIIKLDTLEAPERYDHPELGAHEQVDPEAAARRILAAHRSVRGNSTHAARLMGLTYQGLRRAIRRFDEPRRCSDGTSRLIRVDVGDGTPPHSLDTAVEHLRTAPNRAAREVEARAQLSLAVGDNIRLVDIARRMKIDATRLTKFRAKTGHLSSSELDALLEAVYELRQTPIAPKPGRRAA